MAFESDAHHKVMFDKDKEITNVYTFLLVECMWNSKVSTTHIFHQNVQSTAFTAVNT